MAPARDPTDTAAAGAPGGLVLYGRMPAPITPMDLEVSGYNALYIGDPNDFWVVEVLDEWSSQPVATGTPSVRILSTPIRLRHVGTGCYLWYAGAHRCGSNVTRPLTWA